MKLHKGVLGGLVLAAALAAGSAAAADPTVIRVGNWVPGHHLITRAILEPWAKAIETESGGTLKLDIMKSAMDRPPAYFDLVVNGAIDVGWGVSGHNPGRFTMTQVMDLPFMSPDPWAGAAAAWVTYQKYGKLYGEHKGVHVLGLWTHSEPYLSLRGDPVESVAALKGMKVRVGGNVTGRIFAALGATPVQLPPTEAQQAMARGVADGIAFPLESVEFFKITPVIKSAVRIPGGMYTDTFWLAMNEAKWTSLTDQQRAAFTKHSGMAVAMLGGWAWTAGDDVGRAAMEKQGVKFVSMPAAEVDKMKAALRVLEDEWLAEAKKRGLPGEEILGYAKTMAQAYSHTTKKVNIP